MSSNPFLPQGNTVSIPVSTVSNGMAMPTPSATTLLVTNPNRSDAWVAWSPSGVPTATFPTPGDTVGVQGVYVLAGSQVAIGVQNQAAFVSGVLLSGSGNIIITPGDGL